MIEFALTLFVALALILSICAALKIRELEDRLYRYYDLLEQRLAKESLERKVADERQGRAEGKAS